ncbi:MAG TPA: ECF transporter S component [Clostridiales bacterium]|nr:ECF transporter S component [Clostridiales bacterium]
MSKIRKITITAILAALSTVLMSLSFSVPLVPSFLKLDFSDFPALVASFAIGPFYGAVVCLVKNMVNVLFTTTGGVGELCNFILSAVFVVAAGLLKNKIRGFKGIVIGSVSGAVAMAAIGIITNYFVVYPMYSLIIPMDVILNAYRLIYPQTRNLLHALIIFNMPFTLFKGLINAAVAVIVLKRLLPFLMRILPFKTK